MYVDKSNECIDVVESEDRLGELYELGITMVSNLSKLLSKSHKETIQIVMAMEQYSALPELEKKLIKYFENEH
jgi:hypothetical protein